MILRFKPEARDDLLAIAQFIGEDNPARATSFIDELLNHCTAIAERPKAYRIRSEWGLQVRSAPFGNYQIIYEIDQEAVSIMRVLHARMNVLARLAKGD